LRPSRPPNSERWSPSLRKTSSAEPCMNWGCIPTKFLLHQTDILAAWKHNKNLEGSPGAPRLDWKRFWSRNARHRPARPGVEFLLERAKVRCQRERLPSKRARGQLHHSGRRENPLEFDRAILATGSRPAGLAVPEPEWKPGHYPHRGAELEAAPRSMVVVRRRCRGARSSASSFPGWRRCHHPRDDAAIILPAWTSRWPPGSSGLLKKQGLKILTAHCGSIRARSRPAASASGHEPEDAGAFEYSAEKVLLAAGRSPELRRPSPGRIGDFMDRAGFVRVPAGSRPQSRSLRDRRPHRGQAPGAQGRARGHSGRRKRRRGNRRNGIQRAPDGVVHRPGIRRRRPDGRRGERKRYSRGDGIYMLQANGRAVTMDSVDGMIKGPLGPRRPDRRRPHPGRRSRAR